MKNKRVVFIILVIIAVLAGIVVAYSFFKNKDNRYVTSAIEGDVTRYEWIEMLCGETGMTQYENQMPYFQDVLEGNPHFATIQSAVEWKLLDETSDFCGDEYAVGQFIALTAMKSIGEYKIQLHLDTEDTVSDDIYIELATGLGLMEEENLSRSFSKEECENILDKLRELYFGEFWKDDMESVSYQGNVLELAREDILQENENGLEIKITDRMLPEVKEGTIVIFEYGNSGLKAARKVIGIEGDGKLLLSDDVELDEVLDSLVISDITEVSVEDILNYYGLREGISPVNSLTNMKDNGGRFVPAFSAKMQSKGFAISLETEEEDGKNKVSITVTDNDSGISYLLPIQKEVGAGYEYQAKVDVDKILVASQIEYHSDTGLKYAEVALDTHTTFSGQIDVAGASERILLCETPAPLGSGIVGVKIQIYLVLSIDGTITLEAELPMAACVRYEKGKGICNFKQHISVEEPELKVNCEAGLMLRGELVLVVFMCVDIIDAEADIGAVVSAEIISRPISMSCIDVSAAFPVVSVSVCGDKEADTLVGALGLSGEWEIISSEDAPFKIGLHYEWQSDGTSQFVDECTYDGNHEEEAGDDTEEEAEEYNYGENQEDEVVSDDDWMALYLEVLRKVQEEGYGFDTWDINRENPIESEFGPAYEYCLYDLSGDGIPELLVCFNTRDIMGYGILCCWDMFSYQKNEGRVIHIENCDIADYEGSGYRMSVGIPGDKNGLIFSEWSSGSGEGTAYRLTVMDGVMKREQLGDFDLKLNDDIFAGVEVSDWLIWEDAASAVAD